MKKVISLFIICLFLISTAIFATDLNSILMDLDEPTSSDVTQETIDHDDYIEPEEDSEDDEEEKQETVSTPKVTKTGSTDEEFELTTSDIINIIVISVGVVIILLGIAILIKIR